MADPPASTADRLAALRLRFVERALEQRSRLDAIRAGLTAAAIAPDTLAELLRLCHSLHGAAGTFGFGDISVAAERAEEICDKMIKGAAPAAGGEFAAALARLSELLHGLG